MLVNSSLTVYHKYYDTNERIEKWKRFNYKNIWWYGGKGVGINKGYVNANDVQVRIPYDKNKNLNFNNFSIGDILVKGTLNEDITTQQDLPQQSVFNITSLNDNTFGHNKHISIGGK